MVEQIVQVELAENLMGQLCLQIRRQGVLHVTDVAEAGDGDDEGGSRLNGIWHARVPREQVITEIHTQPPEQSWRMMTQRTRLWRHSPPVGQDRAVSHGWRVQRRCFAR